MPISQTIQESLINASWIRRMFEQGIQLKARYGAENVYDFSIGNPDLISPPEFDRALREEADHSAPRLHGYMPNAGYPETRAAIAEMLSAESAIKFGSEQIIMTCGAAGAINVILKSLLNPGDEVIALAPLFVEYGFYIQNHRGVMVESQTDAELLPDVEDIQRRISPKTRVLLINSPNNPSGRVYPDSLLRAIGEQLRQASERIGHPIYLLADEPYKKIIYDNHEYHSPFTFYPNTIVATSFSKDLSLAGERIGFLAVHPEAEDAGDILNAATFCNRILGYINAPALMQRVIPHCLDANVDVNIYRRRRDLLCSALAKIGYDFIEPEGTFYLFPRSPIEDDVKFVQALQEERILTTPGTGFHRKGHFRISFAVDDETVAAAIPGFEKVFNRITSKT